MAIEKALNYLRKQKFLKSFSLLGGDYTIVYLRKQKFLKSFSRNAMLSRSMDLRKQKFLKSFSQNLKVHRLQNLRKQKFLKSFSLSSDTTLRSLSTKVEILKELQPALNKALLSTYLRKQKFLKSFSHLLMMLILHNIYESRNS